MLFQLLNLFFPKTCHCCTMVLYDNEHHVCTTCRHHLPVTNYHNTNDDTVKAIFFGRAKITKATALLRFEKKGITQKLIHELKYKNQENIGVFLGAWLGSELANNVDYKDIDLIIPVPLHKRKLKKRGYNQVDKFGREIATALNASFSNSVLLKETNTKSQVSKKRFARWNDGNALFRLKNPEILKNKHILLVDDIITTGATLESCILELNKAQDVKISIAVMAVA